MYSIRFFYIFLYLVAFKVYDIDDDGLVTKDELQTVLKLMVGSALSDEELSEVLLRTLEAIDSGKGQVRWEEFLLAMSHVDVKRLMSLRYPACSSP